MSQTLLLAQFVAPWATNWLTTIWILSLGATIGLLCLVVIWGVAFGLSRTPLGRVAEMPGTRGGVAGLLGVVCFAVLGGFLVLPQVTSGADPDSLVVLTCLLAIVSTLTGLALVWLTARRTVVEVPAAVREGPLWPFFVLCCVMVCFTAVGSLVAFQPQQLLLSLARVPFLGTTTQDYSIPATDFEALGDAADPDQHRLDISFRVAELHGVEMFSSESLSVDLEEKGDYDLEPMFKVPAGETFRWRIMPDAIEQEEINGIYFRNQGSDEAKVSVTLMTRPQHPEVQAVVPTAIGVVTIFLLYVLQRAAMPRLSAVSLSTLKSETAQPLFVVMMLTGLTVLLLFLWIPYNTFGEDIKVLKDSGMTLIMVLCIIQAIWASSTSVSEEIEGRTALTVLSKPINRRSFIIGKFLGISWTVLLMFVFLGLMLMLVTAYKPIYDARESGQDEATWQLCHLETLGVTPGLVLAFMETLVLAALSVAISTRLPLLANFVICFTIYVMGHLTPLLVQSSVGDFAPVEFIATLLAAALPVLDHFNIQAAIAAGIEVPPNYLGWSLVYCLIYGMIALLLALVLFEDRDLA